MKAGSKNALALALDDAELQLRQELADRISQMKKARVSTQAHASAHSITPEC